MVEQLGTNGSKHARLETNGETHGVSAGIFGKPGYRNTFFSSLRTALPCSGTNHAIAEIYRTHLHPPLLVWSMALWSIHDAKFGL